MEQSKDIAAVIAIFFGGLLGALSAIAIKKPVSRIDGVVRTLLGVVLSMSTTSWACELIGITDGSYSKIAAIALAIGFVSWHAFSIVMILIDSILEKVDKKKLGFLGDLLSAFRGNPSEVLKGPDVVQVTQIKQTTTVTSPQTPSATPTETPKEQ